MYSDYTRNVASSGPDFDFVAAHFACERDKFCTGNPNGFVNLGSAQNYLAKQDLGSMLSSINHDDSDAEYHPFTGIDRCKSVVAAHLQTYCGAPISPSQIVLGNGLISLLEALSVAICNRSDRVLVPTPVFPGLVNALRLRTGVAVALVQTHPEHGFRVTPELLTSAIEEGSLRGEPIKAVLLCSPGNPVGHVYSHEELREFVCIAEQESIALIVDEVYAMSCFTDVKFESAIDFGSPHVFVLGGLSKDFGVAGYAVGWLHGTNERIMGAVGSQSHFFRLATPAQRATEQLLSPDWTTAYLPKHRRRITESFQFTKGFLREGGVATLEAQAGLCAVLDLRRFLPSSALASKEACSAAAEELQLYRYLLREHRVHVSPSFGFHWNQPGLFRICVTTDDRSLREGLRRIRAGLLSLTHDAFAQPAGR